MVTVKEVITKNELSTYIFLPRKLYAGYANWVPPIYGDEWKFHSPRHNEAIQYCDVIRFLAINEGRVEGRIMGIINKPYNQKHNEKTARFYNLDCTNNPEVCRILIQSIEQWAVGKGMDKVIGPFGFSDKDPQGLKTEGFEHLAVILTASNPPYLQDLVEAAGYTKELDCLSYQVKIPKQLPVGYQKVCDRIMSRGSFRLKEFRKRHALKPYILPVLNLVNETYTNIFGFVPLSETEINKLAAQYLPILDPEFVKLVLAKSGEPVGFVISMPGISEGLQKAHGKLFPFGFIHLLRAMKKTNQLVLLLGAVKPAFRGAGVTALLANALIKSAQKRNMTVIDSHLILESNHLMRAEVENLGGKIYKRFRVYKKYL